MIKKLIRKLKSENINTVIITNTVGAFLVRGAALIVSLFTMPAYMRYFSDETVLGVWYTILSVLLWILSFDLGIGNGLRNKLVKAISENDQNTVRGYISSAYFMVGFWSGIILTVGLAISSFIPWNTVFNVSPELITPSVMLRAVRSVFFGIILQFFLRLITSILYALQRSAVNNFLGLLSSVIQLGFVLLAPSRTPEANLIMLSDFYIVSANLPLLLATFYIFSTKLKSCFPRLRYVQRDLATSVLKLGGMFFWCQVMYMVIVNTNEFFISQYTDPAYVVEYQIYNRLFSLAGTLLTLAMTPIWSAVTKAIADKNYVWLNKLFRLLKRIGWAVIGGEFLLIPFLQIIINIWLQEKAITVNYAYALIFAVFGGVFLYQSILSTIVCGTGRMRLQMVCYTVGVVLKFVLLLIGFQFYQNWILVIIVNTLILFPYCILEQISINRYLNIMEKNIQYNRSDMSK
jgi:O-antigen/teichoic acid export membrane protein